MLHMPCPMLLAVSDAPKGQRLFSGFGGDSFVVPAGVTSICAVAIAPGQPSSYDGVEPGNATRGGRGGGLAYSNAISVTPGQTLSIDISPEYAYLNGPSGFIVLARNDGAAQVGQASFHGGAGSTSGIGVAPVSGGGAAGYGANGGNGVAGVQVGGGGTSVYGGSGGGNNGGGQSLKPSGTAATDYGGGASSNANANGGVRGAGAVRIIWGDGRAYPNTNTGDV